MAKGPSTTTTKDFVGKDDVMLTLNDGRGTLKTRSIQLLAADDNGICYVWSFRGSPREDYAPWGAIQRMSIKRGASKEFPPKSWAKKFKKAKPSASGMKVVGKTCEVKVQDLGMNDEDRHTTLRGYVCAIDERAILFVHNQFGQVYTTVVGMNFLINVEYREKKDTKPPGVK